MKILMLRPSYYPQISGGTHLAMDLVEDLIKDGHKVKLVVPMPTRLDQKIIDDYRNKKTEILYDGSLEIVRLTNRFSEKNIVLRAFRMLDTAFNMFKYIIKEKDIDIIFSHSMPIFLGPLSVIGGKLKKKPVIYWEQDIISESIVSTNIAGKGFKRKVLYKFARRLEKKTSKKCTHIITISNKFKQRQLELKKPENKVDVVYNWIDTDEVYPIERKDNYLFDKFNLDRTKFYVTYCGNLGIPQNVEILIDAAKCLKEIKDLQIVIFGNGVRKNKIEDYLNESGTNNCILLPLQPIEDTKYVYSLGDVGVVIGRKGTSNNGFPSKTWSILAAGQAMISCFDIDSELSEFVKDGKCGISIEPDSSEKLKNAILKMYDNREQTKQYGINSRKYVIENFSRKIATKKIIEIINKVKEENEKIENNSK